LFFLRQEGDVVWGVGVPVLAARDTLPLRGGRYTALHGTVRAGKTVHLDIGEVGSIDPEDKAFAPALANGSIRDLHPKKPGRTATSSSHHFL
jgi:hypothetical protein